MRKLLFSLQCLIGVTALYTSLIFAGPVNHLHQLSCATDQVAKFDGSKWDCAEDNDTSAVSECVLNEVLLGDGTCADASINKLSCAYDEVAKYDDVLYKWFCAEDTDTDTNATTECSDSEVLFADGSCVDASGLLILPTERFVFHGDGTVSDNQTGLMWQLPLDKDGTEGGNCTDSDQGDRDVRCENNTYTWSSDDADVTDPDGKAFTVFLKKLNTDSAEKSPVAIPFADYDDWRMPTISEFNLGCDGDQTCLGVALAIESTIDTGLVDGIWTFTTYPDTERAFIRSVDAISLEKIFPLGATAVRTIN